MLIHVALIGTSLAASRKRSARYMRLKASTSSIEEIIGAIQRSHAFAAFGPPSR